MPLEKIGTLYFLVFTSEKFCGLSPPAIKLVISSNVDILQSDGISLLNGSKSMNQDLKINCACFSKLLFYGFLC